MAKYKKIVRQQTLQDASKPTGGGKSPRSLAIIDLPITELEPDPQNPRQHSPKQIRQIALSIKTFGFNVPVLIDSTGKVIAGHGRLLAARQLDLDKVPTILLDHLNEAQARAFMIADNKLTENAEWDLQLLGEQMRDLSLLDLDFDIEITGFETAEIDLMIDGAGSSATTDRDPADDLRAVAGPAVTKLGDRWILDKHVVLCGDALDPASYTRLLVGAKAHMVFTDPPYNVRIDGNVSGFGSTHHREFAMASGEMTADAFTDILSAVMMALSKRTAPGSIHFYCMDWRHQGEILDAASAARLRPLNMCVWVKDSAGMGSMYRSQHELVFVFKNGRERHRNNVELGRFGRNRTNVWNYPGAIGLRSSDEGNLIALHATPKPAAMVADAIMDVSARGDIVLDPFLGSGTTVIAAQRIGRRCYGIEIDPLYCDVIVRRWQAFTRDRAICESDGRSFNEIEEEVREKNAE
jgi:DNA modification methylase